MQPCVFGEGTGFYDTTPQLDFGMMYHGVTYADEAYSEETTGRMTVRLWRAVMQQGVIEYLPPQECIHRPVREMQIKPFGVDKHNFAPIEAEVM